MNPSRSLVPFGRTVVPRTGSAPVRSTGLRPVAPRPGARPPAPVGRTGPSTSTSPGSTPSTPSAQLPAGVDGVPGSTSMTLGPDWATLGRFGFVAALLLIAGPGIGRTIAGPAGIIIGSGATAAVLLVAPHLTPLLAVLANLVRRLSTLGRLVRARIDSAMSTGRSTAAPAVGSPGAVPVRVDVLRDNDSPRSVAGPTRAAVGWSWVCSPCGLASLPASTSGEAHDLAAVHDGLHHGTRPTARVARHTAVRGPVQPFRGLPAGGAE